MGDIHYTAVRYLLTLLLLTATARAAQVADVRYTFGDFTTSPSSVRRVQITPIQGYNATGSTIITGDRRTFTNDSSGVLIVSNVVVGASYRVDLNGQYTVTSFTNTFPSGTTGLVEAVDYISVPTNAAGTVAFSMTASDLRYATPAQVTNIAQIYATGLGYVAQPGSENLTNWSLLDPNDFSPGGGTGQTNWDFSSITNEPWVEESSIGTAAYSNSSAFYLSSNPSSYITIGDVPAQRTQWSVATVTNSGTAAYSNAAAFLTPAQIGTAAYSNASAFATQAQLADSTNSALTVATARITSATNTAYSSATAYSDATLATATTRITSATNTAYSSATAYSDAALVTATTRITSATNTAYTSATTYADTRTVGATNKLDTDLRQAIQNATNVPPAIRSVGFGFDGGGAAIQAGTRGLLTIPFTGTIQSCTLLGYPSGSIEVQLWRTNSADASFPPTVVGSIGTNALTSDNYRIDSTLTGWTTLVSSGDVFTVNITTNALSITNLTMILKVQP